LDPTSNFGLWWLIWPAYHSLSQFRLVWCFVFQSLFMAKRANAHRCELTIYFPVKVGKPVLRNQTFIENKKCSPKNTLFTQKLKTIHHEVTCSWPEQQRGFQKWKVTLENSTVFNFFVDFSTDSDSSTFKFFRTGLT
jgi:hypothetical protein